MIKNLYNNLPDSYKSNISKVSYLITNKPKVLVDKKPNLGFPGKEKGGVIFSSDFELGWAVRYSKHPKDPVKFASEERKNIPFILKHLEDYQIPIVWATVGHLFLDICKKGDHDWMHRLPYFDDHWKFTKGDWFDSDPYTTWNESKAWYAPDIIEKILQCKTTQEIACHTFSHIDCSYKNCPPEVLDDELRACIDIASKWGVTLKSLTFPGGTAGNYETLIKYGIEICRKRHFDYEIAYPFRNEQGMLITPTGPCIALGYSQWTIDYLLSRYINAVDKAINNNSLVHFWFHPSQEEETFTLLLPKILDYCSKKRETGKLWIGTMASLAEHVKQMN